MSFKLLTPLSLIALDDKYSSFEHLPENLDQIIKSENISPNSLVIDGLIKSHGRLFHYLINDFFIPTETIVPFLIAKFNLLFFSLIRAYENYKDGAVFLDNLKLIFDENDHLINSKDINIRKIFQVKVLDLVDNDQSYLRYIFQNLIDSFIDCIIVNQAHLKNSNNLPALIEDIIAFEANCLTGVFILGDHNDSSYQIGLKSFKKDLLNCLIQKHSEQLESQKNKLKILDLLLL
jgi:hypothetical protein